MWSSLISKSCSQSQLYHNEQHALANDLMLDAFERQATEVELGSFEKVERGKEGGEKPCSL